LPLLPLVKPAGHRPDRGDGRGLYGKCGSRGLISPSNSLLPVWIGDVIGDPLSGGSWTIPNSAFFQVLGVAGLVWPPECYLLPQGPKGFLREFSTREEVIRLKLPPDVGEMGVFPGTTEASAVKHPSAPHCGVGCWVSPCCLPAAPNQATRRWGRRACRIWGVKGDRGSSIQPGAGLHQGRPRLGKTLDRSRLLEPLYPPPPGSGPSSDHRWKRVSPALFTGYSCWSHAYQ